jgi:hypothetical protein
MDLMRMLIGRPFPACLTYATNNYTPRYSGDCLQSGGYRPHWRKSVGMLLARKNTCLHGKDRFAPYLVAP